MVSILVFSITTAGLLVLMLGERLGLPAPLGVLALQALLALACGLLILFSATNRLDPYLAEAPRARGFGRVARLALLLFAGLMSSGGLALDQPARVALLLAGYAMGTLLLFPREAGFGAGPAAGLRAGGIFRRVAVAGLALVLFILWLPQVLSLFAAALQREPGTLRSVVMAGLALGVAVGGAVGLSRLARAILLLGLVFALVPLGLAATIERSFPLESLRGTVEGVMREVSVLLPSGAWRQGLPDLLAGFAIGALGSAQRTHREPISTSLLIAILAPVLAIIGALLVMVEVVRLHGLIISQIADQPPARWPLFVFDEAIRGWLSVCGEAPRDVLDAFRACRARGLSGGFLASEIRLDPTLLGPAVAASRGLPVVLGAGWMLAAPLACLIAMGLLLHGAAVLISETVLYRRSGEKALRSTRLLLARLCVLAPMVALFLLPAEARLDARLALWLMLGCASLILVARLADALRAGVIAWQSRAPRILLTPSAEAT